MYGNQLITVVQHYISNLTQITASLRTRENIKFMLGSLEICKAITFDQKNETL